MSDLFGADPAPNDRDEILAKWKDKSPEEVLKAKVESDLYIKTLEKQKDELRADYLSQREELLAKARFEDLIDRLEKNPKDLDATPLAPEVREPKLDPKDIDNLVTQKIEEARIRERQNANLAEVETKLKERFGDDYRAALRGTGLSEQRLNEIASEAPEAIYRLVGLNDTQRETFQTPPRSAQRNDSFAPKGQTKRDWNYYQELKKANPLAYLDNKIAVQMHNDVIEMGEAAFYGRN